MIKLTIGDLMNKNNLYKVLGTVAILAIILNLTTGNKAHKTDESKAEATVMITNLSENHGGTGVVLTSFKNGSEILTNGHVCGVVKNGGIVKNKSERGFVTSYYVSQVHDLCLIKTTTNFQTSTKVSDEPAPPYSTASISGHPHLNPTIITKGSFSDKQFISVMTGFRPCTAEDQQDPTGSIICMLLGGFPVIRTYEAQFVGATIQAGNSGSAVYNESGEVAGLVFAGSGELGYAIIVPQEYVYNFLNTEAPSGKYVSPNTVLDLTGNTNSSYQALKINCVKLQMGDETLASIAQFCQFSNNELLF